MNKRWLGVSSPKQRLIPCQTPPEHRLKPPNSCVQFAVGQCNNIPPFPDRPRCLTCAFSGNENAWLVLQYNSPQYACPVLRLRTGHARVTCDTVTSWFNRQETFYVVHLGSNRIFAPTLRLDELDSCPVSLSHFYRYRYRYFPELSLDRAYQRFSAKSSPRCSDARLLISMVSRDPG